MENTAGDSANAEDSFDGFEAVDLEAGLGHTGDTGMDAGTTDTEDNTAPTGNDTAPPDTTGGTDDGAYTWAWGACAPSRPSVVLKVFV